MCFIRDTLNGVRKRFLKFQKIQLTTSVAYKITDYNGEEIQGSFYEQEFQKRHKAHFELKRY